MKYILIAHLFLKELIAHLFDIIYVNIFFSVNLVKSREV